ncbi:MAG: urea ABC transporter permease subunit UrtB [Pseudomonadota bacterium]
MGLLAGPAAALTPEQAHALAAGDNDERIAALQASLARGDEGLAPMLQALLDDAVKLSGGKAWIVRGEGVTEAGTGTPAPSALPADAEEVINSNQMRREIDAALAALQLFSDQLAQRQQAVRALTEEGADVARLPLVDKALTAETDEGLKVQLQLLRATLLLGADDVALRTQAVQALARAGRTPAVRALLLERLKPVAEGGEGDAGVRRLVSLALNQVESRLAWADRLGVLFTGVSLGSILLLAALGLAITYGLMGVINMAHGELMMVGAYATYVVQNLFKSFLPAWFDAYILVAIPVAFLVSALVGAAMERSVIRWLYGRPLETLLATWGLSLVLMQTVRTVFGAQNVPVENPAWLSGGVVVLGHLTLPYNRIAIVAFAALVLVGVSLLMTRTRLGLFVRGVTQNRRMAACVGIHTARIDTFAFALGSGLAGLAGCALSQLGNVGPDLGQSYIVDSFMVVVLGGVGQLAGTVYAALGLGVLNKLLENWQGAVLAKIMVLVLIVVFIQKRPQGLFAMKGRSAEA